MKRLIELNRYSYAAATGGVVAGWYATTLDLDAFWAILALVLFAWIMATEHFATREVEAARKRHPSYRAEPKRLDRWL